MGKPYRFDYRGFCFEYDRAIDKDKHTYRPYRYIDGRRRVATTNDLNVALHGRWIYKVYLKESNHDNPDETHHYIEEYEITFPEAMTLKEVGEYVDQRVLTGRDEDPYLDTLSWRAEIIGAPRRRTAPC